MLLRSFDPHLSELREPRMNATPEDLMKLAGRLCSRAPGVKETL
jgi:hypothetical protein